MGRVRMTAALLAVVAVSMAVAAPARAVVKPTAIVSLGDSYISGEGGRWNGNSNDGFDPDRDGTDRAVRYYWWGGWYYEYEDVYIENSWDDGCHRSDVALIHANSIPVAAKVNLACSGAETVNIWRAASGGQPWRGEPPQADQLAGVASQYDVKLIVLSIGGNDLGFTDIITECATNWTIGSGPCWPSVAADVAARLPAMHAGVAKSIDEIRAVMSAAGYALGSYRIVLQSYPSPIPRASETRYSESGWDRLFVGGCPFYNADLDYARDSLVPLISAEVRAIAAEKGVQLLDLQSSFQGREVCATASSLVNGDGDTPSSTTHEWIRFLVSGFVQGDLQESFHPNAFGEQAEGVCLSKLWLKPNGFFACTNTPGKGFAKMKLTRIG